MHLNVQTIAPVKEKQGIQGFILFFKPIDVFEAPLRGAGLGITGIFLLISLKIVLP